MRIIIVGGCRSGKSWLAREYRRRGVPTFCGDPRSEVKEPESGVTYLPEGLAFSGHAGPSPWIIEHWFTMPGPWVLEGHCMARALRRWVESWGPHSGGRMGMEMPCDRIIALHGTRPECGELLPGQLALNKGVRTVWNQIEFELASITENRWWGDGRQWGAGPKGEPTL